MTHKTASDSSESRERERVARKLKESQPPEVLAMWEQEWHASTIAGYPQTFLASRFEIEEWYKERFGQIPAFIAPDGKCEEEYRVIMYGIGWTEVQVSEYRDRIIDAMTDHERIKYFQSVIDWHSLPRHVRPSKAKRGKKKVEMSADPLAGVADTDQSEKPQKRGGRRKPVSPDQGQLF